MGDHVGVDVDARHTAARLVGELQEGAAVAADLEQPGAGDHASRAEAAGVSIELGPPLTAQLVERVLCDSDIAGSGPCRRRGSQEDPGMRSRTTRTSRRPWRRRGRTRRLLGGRARDRDRSLSALQSRDTADARHTTQRRGERSCPRLPTPPHTLPSRSRQPRATRGGGGGRDHRVLQSLDVAICSAGPRIRDGAGWQHGEPGELLERSVELGVIHEGAEAATAGEGRAIVVEGPAGIGKTALVAAARDRARQAGLTPLGARAAELERTFGYGVVRQLLEPAVHAAAAAPLSSRVRRAMRRRCSTSHWPSPRPCPPGRRVRSPSCTASTASRPTSPATSRWRSWWTTRSGPTARRCGSSHTSRGGSATCR